MCGCVAGVSEVFSFFGRLWKPARVANVLHSAGFYQLTIHPRDLEDVEKASGGRSDAGMKG